MEFNQVLKKIDEVNQNVIEWRRYLHQHPELSFEEVNTAQYVYDLLTSFGGFELSKPTKTSVMARLKGTKPGKVIALRADMDALPIHEETALPFASANDGIMHACGHDGHTSMLLGAAKILSEFKDSLSGEIVFLFQHAEELPPGGAREMVAAGVLDGVDYVLGVHLFSTIPYGTIGVRHGSLTAASDVFEITVQGKGGHASTPELTVDPLATGAQIVTGLNHIVSRTVAPLQSAVVSVTNFHGGNAVNVIPDTVKIAGSVRTLDAQVRETIRTRIIEVAEGIAKSNGAQAKVDYLYGYNSVVNDVALTDKVAAIIEKNFTDKTLDWVDPMLGGEDFSAFSDEKPGCFVLIGAGFTDGKGAVYPHHHPKFDIDEEALKDGVKFHVLMALTLTSE